MKGWIEKHSTWIGIGLIVLSLIGGGLLIFKKGAGAGSTPPAENKDQEIADLKSKISDLEAKIDAGNSAAQTPASENTTSPSSTSTKSSQPTGKININTASANQLDSLPGIGPTYAQRIIDYRNTNGPYTSLEQIKNVKGIGDKTYAKFKDLITI